VTRERELTRAQRFATGLTAIAVLTALLALFGPQPDAPLLALLLALPLLAIICVIAWRNLFRIGLGTGLAQANLAAACAVAACALFARTLLDLNLVSWLPLTAFAIAVAVVSLLAAISREPNLRRRWWRLLLASVIIGAYAFGVMGQFDLRLDRSPQAVLRSRVLDKRLGHTRMMTYHVTLAPWGPFSAPADATVPQELYEQLDIGDPTCVRLHDGALGMAWYTVMACR
jgi:ABC-type branched-subunit amino acid transport system permease subunit